MEKWKIETAKRIHYFLLIAAIYFIFTNAFEVSPAVEVMRIRYTPALSH
jgi:hypothetical protein